MIFIGIEMMFLEVNSMYINMATKMSKFLISSLLEITYTNLSSRRNNNQHFYFNDVFISGDIGIMGDVL